MYQKINEELQRLKDLLKMEKKADFEQFRNEIIELSVAEKREKGLCWYPLQIIKEGYTLGERAFVTVERTAQRNEPHRFKSGTPVDLYSGADDKFSKSQNRSQSGVIYFVEKNKMKIILNSKDLPDWLNNGQLGVDLLFDERTYLEMERALNTLIKTNNGRIGELKAIFYGKMEAHSDPLPTIHNPYLNESQRVAIQQILASRDVTVVHGPPGTGKNNNVGQCHSATL